MPCIKFLDLKCKACKAVISIDLKKITQNFACWQGVACSNCHIYNDFRMRKAPIFEHEQTVGVSSQ